MASTIPDRGTKINMDLVPTIESSQVQRSHIIQHLSPIEEVARLRKRKASPLKTIRVRKQSRGVQSASNATTIERSPQSQAVVPVDETASAAIETIWESPWDHYRQMFELNLGGFVFVVSERDPPNDLYMVKKLQDDQHKIHFLQTLRHKNFHQMLECFRFEDSDFAVFDYDPVSLAHVAKSPAYLTELELAAIVGQILAGLAYLEAHDLGLGHLSCSSILLSTDGSLKITGQELCTKATSSPQSLRDLGYITMELMQKYPNSSGSIGLENFERWPSDGYAVGFLAMTTSAATVDQLLSHPLLDCQWKKEDLKWIVALAAIASHRGYRYG